MEKSYDLICLSHLRWNLVFQRPQHLLSRLARQQRVFFFEEPVFGERASSPRLEVRTTEHGVIVAVPHLPAKCTPAEAVTHQKRLLDSLVHRAGIRRPILWYYTPMALPFSRHIENAITVYDCMDELSTFANAPTGVRELEDELMKRADVVFAGGQSLYEAKRHRHHNIHAMPSSVDREHFAQARTSGEDPPDQAEIPRPRAGFFGVIDERMDLELVAGVASSWPNLHLVMIGPVFRIDPASLPRRANIHWLGSKPYDQLPRYIAGWDCAILPFARNPTTRFISPTKTPEYLAAGRPVVSTSIHDVVRPYGEQGLARIADRIDDFGLAILAAMRDDNSEARLAQVDEVLARTSWDGTLARMVQLIGECSGRALGERGPTPHSVSVG